LISRLAYCASYPEGNPYLDEAYEANHKLVIEKSIPELEAERWDEASQEYHKSMLATYEAWDAMARE